MRFGGKVALISGGGTGIGAATARRLAAEGASVVVSGRRPDPLRKVADDVGGLAVPGDLTEPGTAEEVVAAAEDRFGGLDVVVVNAGVGFGRSVADVTDELWDRTIDVNLTAAMRLVRAAVPALADRGSGSIVVVSSVSGVVASGDSAAYVASKAGLIGLATSMAVDLAARGIRANAVCPGWIRTEMADEAMDELTTARGLTKEDAYRLVTSAIPMRRPADPDEVAACIAFLASEEASYVTGATLAVDGGLLAVDPGGLAFDPALRIEPVPSGGSGDPPAPR